MCAYESHWVVVTARGHDTVLVVLLEVGALIKATDDGRTPLMAATNGGHTSIVVALTRCTSDIRN